LHRVGDDPVLVGEARVDAAGRHGGELTRVLLQAAQVLVHGVRATLVLRQRLQETEDLREVQGKPAERSDRAEGRWNDISILS